MRIESEIAKIMSSSGDALGATSEELVKIEKLVNLFKAWVCLLVPEKKEVKSKVWRTLEGYEEVYDSREINFVEGWNACREEMLRRIKKEVGNVC